MERGSKFLAIIAATASLAMLAGPSVAESPTRQLAGPADAGAAMAAQLAASISSLGTPPAVDDSREIGCLALTIYHEARGESERGKLAVGHVVMNRTRSVRFPTSVCDVVRQGGQHFHRCQFSWWCDGRSDRPKDEAALRESVRLAEEIYYGNTRDPTAGALWYHATAVDPSWSQSFGSGKRIGHHVFYRGELDRPVRTAYAVAPFVRAGPARAAPQAAERAIAGVEPPRPQGIPFGKGGTEEVRLWWLPLLVAVLTGVTL
jgi:spore germination cell wall hydrolase CwlJ-like protein